MTIGRTIPRVDLLLRSGDYWAARVVVTDGGDHNRDGIVEDPNNPVALNVSGYEFLCQIRSSKKGALLATVAVDTDDAATGILVLSLTPTQTRDICPPTGGKESVQAVWDFQGTPTAAPGEPLTWWEGSVTDELDVSRT
jgi:hypothetical protein